MALRTIIGRIHHTIPLNVKFDLQRAHIHALKKIGKREIVAFGWNGTTCYRDHVGAPFPAIRFKEPSKESECLHAKELCDWKKLTIPEKKALYRYSFCQTFAELKAPTGEWKMHIGFGLLAGALAIWVSIFYALLLYKDQLPETFDDAHQKAQLKRMLLLEINPIHGLSSKWDYKKNQWK